MPDAARTHRLPALLIAGRNLRGSAHARGPIALRTCVVLVLLLALLTGFDRRSLQAAPGLQLLAWFDNTNLWVIWLCGVLLFPGVVAQEREQRTWPLLRLAGVGPGSFLVGQSLSTIVLMLLAILVQLPFLMLAVALGGTSAHMVVASTALLLAHALCAYGLALMASARARSVRMATLLAALFVLPIAFGPQLVQWLLGGWLTRWGMAAPLAEMSAILPLELLPRLRAGVALPADISRSILVHLTIGSAAALAAWAIFSAKDTDEAGGPTRWWPRRLIAASGDVPPDAPGEIGARYPAGGAALTALSRRLGTGGPRAWTFLGAAYLSVLLANIARQRARGRAPIDVLVYQGLVVVVLATILAAWSMRAHVQQRTVALLAMTQPGTQWLRGLRRARWQTLAVMMGLMTITWAMTERVASSDTAAFVAMTLGAALLGDALSERIALAGVAAPWAVSLLVMLGVGALMIGGGFVFQPRSAVGYFSVHACLYGAVAWSIREQTRQRWQYPG